MSDSRLRAGPSPGAREGAGAAFEGWRARVALARWWISRFALSYLTTAVLVGLSGLVLGLFLDGELRGSDVPNLLVDGFFLFVLANLAVNWTSTGYVFVGDDSFSRRVSFLRSLPTSTRDVVGMRLLVLLATLAVMASLAFLTPYLFFGSVREAFGPYGYLCFVALWASYGLISGCAIAYLEIGFPARVMLLVQMVWSVLLVVLVLAVSARGGGIVQGSARLASSHGALVAGLAILVATGCAYLWYRLAERRLRERELGS